MQYEAAKVETFIDLYITGLYTLQEMCRVAGFSVNTYYQWKSRNPEFKKRLEEADKYRIPEIKEIATRGLMRLCEGATYEEVHEEYERPEVQIPLKYPYLDADDPLNVEAMAEAYKKAGEIKPVLVKRKVSTKVIMPNAASVQFALRNVDKENFPDIQKGELGGAGGKPIPVAVVLPGGMNTSFPSELDPPADDINE